MHKPRGFVFHQIGKAIEIKLTKACRDACAHMGPCDSDVAYWVAQLRSYLDALPAALVSAALRHYGCWDETELADHEQNLRRLLWCAAGSAKDENSCWVYMEA